MKRGELNQIALDPQRSVVVEACAGSGKTWLLVSRILRQLIAGAAPSEILAITFTRKAAQEMQARLHDWLDFLAVSDDTAIHQFLLERSMNNAEIDAAMPLVRSLRDKVAFASPAVTITTFHAWFQQILSQAPLPYAEPARQIADSEWALLDEAWRRMGQSLATRLSPVTTETRLSPATTESTDDAQSAQKQAFTRLFSQFGLQSTKKLLNDFVYKRAEWRMFVKNRLQVSDGNETTDEAKSAALILLAEQLHIDPANDPISLWHTYFHESVLQLAEAFASGSDAARKNADLLRSAFDEEDAEIIFGKVRILILTKQDTLRDIVMKWADKADVSVLLNDICAGLLQTIEAQTHHDIWQQNADALTAGIALLQGYEKLKQEKQLLDYSDLEWRTYELLSDSIHAETMQYKLDCRYRHILLDEFQDTNPIQWLTLKCWLDASVAADGSAGNRPSVFMVGDPKQAIYRFRRADSRLFGFCRDYLVAEFGATFCSLERTYRNAPAIVDFVNAMFGDLEDFPDFVAHTAEQESLAGDVVAIPAFTAEISNEKGESDDGMESDSAEQPWRNPLTTPREETRSESHLAEAAHLAASIQRMVGHYAVTDRDGVSRPASYGDMMILFRRRNQLATFQDALKAVGIPYVGAKPGGLLGTLEAQDIAALLRFLATPDDNLSLAHALKSPMFNLSDAHLCLIADNIEGKSWWQKFQQLTTANQLMMKARELLRAWLSLIDRLPTHDVLDRIYHQLDIYTAYREAVPAAMCRAVMANLDAFMALALQVDSGRYPSLQRFLDELANFDRLPDNDAPDEGDISRNGEGRTDAVQLLTIHAAKGLEAPIVWLVDAATPPSLHTDAYNILLQWPLGETSPSHFSFVTKKEFRGVARADIFAADELAAQRENLNLLYVAATRAKQLFVLSGTEGKRASASLSWLQQAGAIELTPAPNFDFVLTDMATATQPHMPKATAAALTELPVPAIGLRETYSAEQARGINVHKWLELLSAPNPVKASNANNDEAFQLATQILASPDIERFYNSPDILNARNEMEFSFVENGKIQTRRIDRLVEFGHEIWILDYKTGEREDASHQQQLDQYRTAIAPLFAGKKIRTAIIAQDGKLIEF